MEEQDEKNSEKFQGMVRNLLTNKKESDKINMVREWRNPSDFLCGCGGIGRRARLRIWWETVQVQVLSSALNEEHRMP